MFGKALSLLVVAALVAAGAAPASTASRLWVGKTARGGKLEFVRAGKRIQRVRVELKVTCTNEVEATQRDSIERVGFDEVLRIGAGGRIHTVQQHDTSVERWTLTFDGRIGAAKARGKLAWRYEKTSNAGDATICRGIGTSRWTAQRTRTPG